MLSSMRGPNTAQKVQTLRVSSRVAGKHLGAARHHHKVVKNFIGQKIISNQRIPAVEPSESLYVPAPAYALCYTFFLAYPGAWNPYFDPYELPARLRL